MENQDWPYKIPLTQGQFALVDAGDFEYLMQWKWFAWWNPETKSFYAVRNARVSDGGRGRTFYMHRVIMNAPSEMLVDHRDHESLNNRRDNLRLATNSENTRNTRMRKDNSSGFKGVSWHRQKGKWRARITFGDQEHHLGLFDSAEDASAAYVKAAIDHYGEFACLSKSIPIRQEKPKL